MKKVLQLSTYPIAKPLHGGQIRVSQIRKYFESQSCEVKSLSLSEMSHGHYCDDDFLLSDSEIKSLINIPFCTDYSTSLICVVGKSCEFLKKNILAFSPDIILVEQVWLWPAVKKLKSENHLKSDVKIVYSSHNIEYKTKKLLLESHNLMDDKADSAIKGIYDLEKEMCTEADYVIACTGIDASEFKEMGSKEIIICNNGVIRYESNNEVSSSLMARLNGRKYALFVGSAYPPNALGFWKMLGSSLAWLPPEYIIIVAGGVSKILENYRADDNKLYDYVSMDRIKKLGFVTEELLSALLDSASAILLPITVGGGSNLKTAEAIASGKPVVATTTASRGFDFVHNLTNFIITDDQNEFIKNILLFLNKSNIDVIDDHERILRESVYWSHSLRDLKKLL